MSVLHHVSATETQYKSLGVYAHSGMLAPLLGGITTRKEFKSTKESIAFIKAMDYPLTLHIVKELSDISDRTYRNRSQALIEAVISLQQFADDLYSSTRGRTVYGQDGDECLLDKNGTVVPQEQVDIDLVKQLKQLDQGNLTNPIMAVWFTPYIDSYYGVNESAIIEILMSDAYIESFSNGQLFTLPSDNKLRFYFIPSMKHKPVELLGDPKWEKLSIRLITAIAFGTGADKVVEVDPMEQSFREMLGALLGYLLKKHRIENGHKLRRTKTIETLGKHVVDVYIKAVSDGGHVQGRSKSLDYLNKRSTTNLVPKLFKKVSKWKAGGYSIAYEPVEEMTLMVSEAFDSYMRLPVKEVTEEQEHGFLKDENIEYFHKDVLKHISIKDKVFLMSCIMGYRDSKYYFTINAVDRQASRVYSTITAIQSIARDHMGFHNHDMSVAQTAICLQLVSDGSKYPEHQQMIKNKRLFRSQIQEITGWDYSTVKKELSALDNGQSITSTGELS